MLGKISINTKVFAGFAITSALFALLAVAAYMGLTEINRSYERFYQKNFKNLFDIADLKANINAERLDVAVMLEAPRSQWGPWQKDLAVRVKNTQKIIGRLLSGFADDPWKKSKLDDFLAVHKEFVSTRYDRVFPLLREGRIEEAKRLFTGIQLERHIRIREILDELIEKEQTDAVFRLNSTQDSARRYTILFAVTGLLTISISLFMAFLLNRIFRSYITEREQAEKAVRESEERFRKAFEEGPIGMALVGLDYHFMRVNNLLCRMLGYTEDELTQLTFPDITHPDDVSSDVELAAQMFRGEIPNYRIEKRYIKKNGEIIWVGLNASVIRDKNGVPLYGMAMIEDITERKRASEALRASEQEAQRRLAEIEQIYKYAPVGLFIFDREYRFLRINELMADINGFPVDEHIGKSMWEIVPQLADHLKEVYRPVFERGEPVLNVEIHGQTPKVPDIDRDWIASYFPFKSETGEVIGLIGAVLEITERKRIENAFRESEQRFRLMAETIEDVFWMSTPGVTKMIYISPAYENIWKFSRESLYSNPISFLDRVHPDDKEMLKDIFREYHSKGKPYQCEYRIVQPDGSVQWILERGFPAYDGNGGIKCMTGTSSVITERKEAEERLRLSEAELREAQRLAHVGSWDWDAKTDTVTWSEEFYRITGLAPSTPAPDYYKQHYKVYTPESMAKISAAVEKAMKTGEPYELELEVVRPDGTTRWIDATGEVKRDKQGNIIGLRGSVADITERKNSEMALEKAAVELDRSNKELEQFAYVVSHDLQEPLRMIAGFLQLLGNKYKEKLDETAREYIDYAIDGAARQQRMINDLLEYSRVQTKAKPFEKAEAGELLAQALTNLQAALSESNAEVTHDALPQIHADPSQFIRLFQNLISNAVKFRRPEEPPKVRVSSKDNGAEWLFTVTDNGIGIEPQYMSRLFQIFQRLHGRKYPGTGIGLVICKRIVERHGGRIWAESEPGKGTAFHFTVPKR